jgi:hypothetical protein
VGDGPGGGALSASAAAFSAIFWFVEIVSVARCVVFSLSRLARDSLAAASLSPFRFLLDFFFGCCTVGLAAAHPAGACAVLFITLVSSESDWCSESEEEEHGGCGVLPNKSLMWAFRFCFSTVSGGSIDPKKVTQEARARRITVIVLIYR